MSTLPPADRERLAKLLSLLGSDHFGERDAAGLAANRLVQLRGLTWQQALAPVLVEKKLPELGTWRATISACLLHQGALRQWEIGFLRDLPKFLRLSVKQRYVLKEIADRVLRGASA